MTNPEKKLVSEFTADVIKQSLLLAKKLVRLTVNFRAIVNEQDRTLPVTNYL